VAMPEALDVWLYTLSSLVIAPLALPGTGARRAAHGDLLQDPRWPFVFMGVFKLEDRKGWRELCKAFMLEFGGSRGPASKPDRGASASHLRPRGGAGFR